MVGITFEHEFSSLDVLGIFGAEKILTHNYKEMALEFTEANFAELTNTDKPVLVDFWAPWCGPCKMVGPHVEALYDEFEGKALVGKVNVDDHGALAAQYGVRNIPTLIVLKNGEVVEKVVGAVAKDVLAEKLSAHV